MVKCSDNTIYTGMSTDVFRRVEEHNGSKRGAKYTSKRRPVTLIFTLSSLTRVQADLIERRIKKMTRKEKLELATSTEAMARRRAEFQRLASVT